MTSTTAHAENGRGCGTRSEGGTYLSLGIGPGGTLTVEDLILDPIKIWPAGWQRGFKILPNKQGFNDVGIFVGEEFYPSPQDFIEESKRFGISRKVPPTFPFNQLVPGKSRMIFIHKKAYPKFDYYIPDIKAPLCGCKFFQGDSELWNKTEAGYHPRIEVQTKCTFAHLHLAGRIHNSFYDEEGTFIVQMPSFSYSGRYPLIKPEKGQSDMTWEIGAFMVAPISHIEMPIKENKSAKNRANKAGFEVIRTDW